MHLHLHAFAAACLCRSGMRISKSCTGFTARTWRRVLSFCPILQLTIQFCHSSFGFRFLERFRGPLCSAAPVFYLFLRCDIFNSIKLASRPVSEGTFTITRSSVKCTQKLSSFTCHGAMVWMVFREKWWGDVLFFIKNRCGRSDELLAHQVWTVENECLKVRDP